MNRTRSKLIGVGSRTSCQHTNPCSDCPWRRVATRGWLGSLTAEDWIQAAHGETKIDCHVHLPWQCVGVAIYRANVCKMPRTKDVMTMPPDRARCFTTPAEFLTHHE